MYFLYLSNQDIGARAITLAFSWVPFQRSKTNKYEDHFFQCSLCHTINLLLTKLVRSRWRDIGRVLFLRFYGPRRILTSRSVNNIYLLYGKLREWAVCSEFCVLIGYPSGQDGAILPARDCPFRSRK